MLMLFNSSLSFCRKKRWWRECWTWREIPDVQLDIKNLLCSSSVLLGLSCSFLPQLLKTHSTPQLMNWAGKTHLKEFWLWSCSSLSWGRDRQGCRSKVQKQLDWKVSAAGESKELTDLWNDKCNKNEVFFKQNGGSLSRFCNLFS